MNERDEHACLIDAMFRLVHDADAPTHVSTNARAWFEMLGVDTEHAAAFAGLGAKRLLLYRKLVRNGLQSTIRNVMPLATARLGPSFDAWIEQYCNEEMPRSHHLRDVAAEFLNWAEPQWTKDPSIPHYVVDLARFELFEFHIATAPQETRPVQHHDLLLDKPIVFDSSTRLARFDHAVQRLDENTTTDPEPLAESTILLGYRDATHNVELLELNALAADILERLLGGETLGAAITQACDGVLPPVVLESIAQLLADLAERKIIFGAG